MGQKGINAAIAGENEIKELTVKTHGRAPQQQKQKNKIIK
jgi:hypothetical protein